MELLFGVALLLPVVILALLATYVYLDAAEYGMNPRLWAAISFFVPLFGFFMYLFERDDRTPDPDRDEMFVDGAFEIHESRADDTPLASSADKIERELEDDDE